MRNSPYYLAAINLLITISRVAGFVAVGLHQEWQGWAFACVLAVGVYVTTYFMQFKETRKWAIAGAIFAVLVDLWFNEAELIRTLSSQQMVLPGSEFLSMNADTLKIIMQISAIALGAVPTIFAGLFGALQSGAEKIASLNKPSALSKMFVAVFSVVSSFTWRVAAQIEGWVLPADGNSENAGFSSVNMPQLPVNKMADKPRRWAELTNNEVAKIPAMNRAEMMAFFGISDGTCGDWKRRISAGERPRKQLEEIRK